MAISVASVMTLEELRSVPLFAGLDDGAARELRDLLQVREVLAATPLFHHGDSGDAMYLIDSGRVRISVHDSFGHEVTLAELAGGDFFGEMAVLDGKARAADATVIEDARLAILAREDFLAFVRRNPEVALKMLSAITNRLRDTDELLRQRVSRNANVEEAARLTMGDRLANRIAEFGGSWRFLIVLMALLLAWVIVNTYVIPKLEVDPYPYQLLGLVLGVIAGVQAPIIMMSQNRQGDKDRLRADLDFQINLKNEISLAEILRRLDVLESERLPLLFDEQNRRLCGSGEEDKELAQSPKSKAQGQADKS
jgi:CRP/FNR family transcriptional regulator, cyclic AMP receptor protein